MMSALSVRGIETKNETPYAFGGPRTDSPLRRFSSTLTLFATNGNRSTSSSVQVTATSVMTIAFREAKKLWQMLQLSESCSFVGTTGDESSSTGALSR